MKKKLKNFFTLLASTALFSGANVYAGVPTPYEEVDTNIHGPTKNIYSNVQINDKYYYLNLLVYPYPDIATSSWVDFTVSIYDYPGYSNYRYQSYRNCMAPKKLFQKSNFTIHPEDWEDWGCTHDSSGTPFDIEEIAVQLTEPNGIETTKISGDREFCRTVSQSGEGEPYILFCNGASGGSQWESVGGLVTLKENDGGATEEVEFSLDPIEYNWGVASNARTGKCNILMNGAPVEYIYQIQSACDYFGGD